ncbi:PKD domain-containing protein [Algoriphagus litoralis]|uniref:PKD domain-containing protein n=1 Tax=Algoriphagus litoralis TaxID=2202829 RepID=UPI000DB95C53|nr:PKD domain-containing protein [Algoriphagus litoralis]
MGLKGKLRNWILVFFALLGLEANAQIGFPYCETFQTPSTQANTIFGGDARLIDGVLRLTSNQLNQRGHIYVDVPFPSSYGLKVEFEYFSYGGVGQFLADGLSLFLFDADTQVFNAGGFGGSLGYAQRSGEPGLSNAYLGIGFDEFGNFGNRSEGKNGGFAGVQDELVPDAIVIRGPGNGNIGYPFVVGRRTMTTGNDGLTPGGQFPISSGGAGTSRVTDPMQVGYRRVNLELQPDPDGVGFFLTLTMIVTTEPGLPRQLTIFDRPYDFPAPKNLKIGFAASTGGFSNFHEIRNLIVEVSADDQLQDPQGVDFSDIASCAGQENQFNISDEEVVLPNENSVIRCLQFYQSLEDIQAESEDVCSQARCLEQNRVLILPQGTFRASDQAGGFTFFPNDEFIDQEVTVYYTITDSYGKTSKGNSMTLAIQESPEPISLRISGESELANEIDICEGELVSLEGTGNEVYDRFEWYKDGELIEGATQSTFSTGEAGEYEVFGYNRKNCPAKSNKIVIVLPDLPIALVDLEIVGCLVGQTVDVTSQILDYNPSTFDYQLSGNGLILLNDEMKSVGQSGMFELRIKQKNLDCYSEGIPLEIFIQPFELTVDYDFGVQGTGVKDEAGGGVFPSDVIQFTDLSDNRAVSWDWDFGDGNRATEKNPTHVFGKKGDFNVVLIITDRYGCQQSISKTVSITRSYRLMIPTGFTPNEEQNNTFLPKQKGLVSFELLIFNTWGELIFQTEDLNTLGWDGTLNGKLLDAGIFVYRVNGETTDAEMVKESGKFRLIR